MGGKKCLVEWKKQTQRASLTIWQKITTKVRQQKTAHLGQNQVKQQKIVNNFNPSPNKKTWSIKPSSFFNKKSYPKGQQLMRTPKMTHWKKEIKNNPEQFWVVFYLSNA